MVRERNKQRGNEMSIEKVLASRQGRIENVALDAAELTRMASERLDICEESRALLVRIHQKIVQDLAAIDRDTKEATLALLSK